MCTRTAMCVYGSVPRVGCVGPAPSLCGAPLPYVSPSRALPARAKSLYIPPSLWAMHGPTPTVIVRGVKVRTPPWASPPPSFVCVPMCVPPTSDVCVFPLPCACVGPVRVCAPQPSVWRVPDRVRAVCERTCAPHLPFLHRVRLHTPLRAKAGACVLSDVACKGVGCEGGVGAKGQQVMHSQGLAPPPIPPSLYHGMAPLSPFPSLSLCPHPVGSWTGAAWSVASVKAGVCIPRTLLAAP